MIETRGYSPADEREFLLLYRECLRHYQIDPATNAQEARALELLAVGRHMSCLMAYDKSRPVGFATWALTLPAGAGIALYIKEIFVMGSAQGEGVGRALLRALIQIAKDEGCDRMDWQTDGSNTNAQSFYASIDAPQYDKRSFRVMHKDFARFLERLG